MAVYSNTNIYIYICVWKVRNNQYIFLEAMVPKICTNMVVIAYNSPPHMFWQKLNGRVGAIYFDNCLLPWQPPINQETWIICPWQTYLWSKWKVQKSIIKTDAFRFTIPSSFSRYHNDFWLSWRSTTCLGSENRPKVWIGISTQHVSEVISLYRFKELIHGF